MKKSRIPDLTPAPKRAGSAPGRPSGAKSPAPLRTSNIKPQATSAKSGRRGQ